MWNPLKYWPTGELQWIQQNFRKEQWKMQEVILYLIDRTIRSHSEKKRMKGFVHAKATSLEIQYHGFLRNCSHLANTNIKGEMTVAFLWTQCDYMFLIEQGFMLDKVTETTKHSDRWSCRQTDNLPDRQTDRPPYRLMELTEGTFSWSQTLSERRRSRISQANMVGFSRLYLQILSTTLGVATFGLDPPITPGLIEPVS